MSGETHHPGHIEIVTKARGDERCLVITAMLTSVQEVDLFAEAFNAAHGALWPAPVDGAGDAAPAGEMADEANADAGDPPLGPIQRKVLALLRAGDMDEIAMAARCATSVHRVRIVVESLVRRGLWSKPEGDVA